VGVRKGCAWDGEEMGKGREVGRIDWGLVAVDCGIMNDDVYYRE